jgi:predicted ATPase/DNA-binding winged helix-turn-helix (wHTH) protein
MSSTPWSFDGGRVRIDAAARLLIVNGEPAKLGGRAFDLLLELAEQRERVVTKGELLDRVWPGLVVEENNLQVHVMTLRKWLGNSAIVTVSGRGYRWTLPPSDTAAAPPAAWPAAAGDGLVGRDSLLAQAMACLDGGHRVVTLTGPGGAGKTRVAQRIAALRGERLPCWFVMLAPAPDMAQFWAALAAVLGVQESGATPLPELVRSWLAPRAALLVLDNLEHLAGAGEAVAALRAACPQLQFLATSRTLLHVADEQVLRVPPLAAVDASALFVRRAADAGRPVSCADELDLVPSICERLDGLPLAIELAASRLRVLSPAALATRLQQRLPLLKGGPRDAPARQQTLRDTIGWSHDLLPPAQQALFRRLGVFVGGWSLEAAEAIDDDATATLDALDSLLEHNLVKRLDNVEGAPRYAMLETIREFAIDLIDPAGDGDTLRDRHAAWFEADARHAEPSITSAARAPWLARLRADLPNHRAALNWSLRRRDAGHAIPHAAALSWIWYFDGLYREGRDAIAQALALPGGADRDRAAALSGAARLAGFAGDMAEGCELARQSVALWNMIDEPRGKGLALWNAGVPTLFVAGRDAAFALLGEAIECFRTADDPWGIALATVYRGVVCAVLPGDEERARLWLAEGLARCRALGDDWAASTCSGYLGVVATRCGRFDEARSLYEHIDESARATGDRFRIGRTAHFLGDLDLRQHRFADALPRLLEALRLVADQGRTGDFPLMLSSVGRALTGVGRHADAVRALAAGARPPETRPSLPQDDPNLARAAIQASREAMGELAFQAAWRAGTFEPIAATVSWLCRWAPDPESGP